MPLPYGYELKDGMVSVNNGEAGKLKSLFRLFTDGTTMKKCLELISIPHCPDSCKAMLKNSVYMGTDLFPPLIEPDLFAAAQEEMARRNRKRRKYPVPVYTDFIFLPGDNDSGKRNTADFLYRQIRPVVKGEITCL